MNKTTIGEWKNLPDRTKHNIFEEISKSTSFPVAAIEKD
jgi:hypothetical protein